MDQVLAFLPNNKYQLIGFCIYMAVEIYLGKTERVSAGSIPELLWHVTIGAIVRMIKKPKGEQDGKGH